MHYRLYVLDRNARIVRGLDLDCRDDGEAIECAIERAGAIDAGHGIEIWQRCSKVALVGGPAVVTAGAGSPDEPCGAAGAAGAIIARSARRRRGDRTAR